MINVSNKCTSPSRRLTKTRADDGNFWLFYEFALYYRHRNFRFKCDNQASNFKL